MISLSVRKIKKALEKAPECNSMALSKGSQLLTQMLASCDVMEASFEQLQMLMRNFEATNVEMFGGKDPRGDIKYRLKNAKGCIRRIL